MKPEELLFTKTHEWVALSEQDGHKIATMGISAFAAEALADLVFIEMPEVGRQVAPLDPLLVVESVKAVSDVYAPLAGEVVEVNQTLPDKLEDISNDPYGAGWMAKIRVSDESGLADLMDYDAYQKQCAEEAE